MALLNPYLQFPGTAREAVETYAAIFGGTPTISTFGDYGAAGGDQAPPADGVMHAQLETDLGFVLMASDLPPGMEVPSGSNVAVSLSGDEAETLRGYFAGLADGGTTEMPLEKQMWGDEFGLCTDRFGISWMVNISEPAVTTAG